LIQLALRLPGPSGRERWPRYLATSVERIHLRSFHRWRDRKTVWGSSSLVGLPNGLQLFDELVCVGLGLPPCCKGIERCVSHLRVLGNVQSIAATLPSVSCDIAREDMGLFHTRIMRRRLPRRQSEITARYPNHGQAPILSPMQMRRVDGRWISAPWGAETRHFGPPKISPTSILHSSGRPSHVMRHSAFHQAIIVTVRSRAA
jgi:hypothetical protein